MLRKFCISMTLSISVAAGGGIFSPSVKVCHWEGAELWRNAFFLDVSEQLNSNTLLVISGMQANASVLCRVYHIMITWHIAIQPLFEIFNVFPPLDADEDVGLYGTTRLIFPLSFVTRLIQLVWFAMQALLLEVHHVSHRWSTDLQWNFHLWKQMVEWVN